ncbi:vinculin A [Tieghemostelium lacteum]|uniref:Vinculin A n=1 Tax=Tieghemostelium lacteum TaxID=361077 RepID=A0A151Z6L8_TIELA|nr:vinculin A [Tieghemostelium lacteum]|eukprot:KYQ89602.1 vinculin A [Tieghemostelium lacteum]
MDEVLEIIADSVSSLVIAITESEEKNTLFGDMVPGVELIQKAVNGMAEAAEETLQMVDDEFKGQLEQISKELKNKSQELYNNACKARDDPWNRVPQKDAIKSAKAILQNVVILVLIEEQSNIKVLVNIAKKAAEGIRRMDEIENTKQLDIMIGDVILLQNELVKRSKVRAEGSHNPDLRLKLEESSVQVQLLSEQHQRACRQVCTSPNDSSLKSNRNELSVQLLSAIDDVIYTIKQIFASNTKFVDLAFKWKPVKTMAEDEVIIASQHLIDNLRLLPKAIQDGRGPEAAREIVNNANIQISNALVVANRCEDPVKKKMILRNIEELKKLTPQLIAAMKPVLANPNDQEAKKALDKLIYSTQKASENLATAVSSSPSEIVAASGASLAREMDSLQDAIARGDKERAEIILANLGPTIDRHIEMAQALLDTITDPALRHQIKTAIDKLQMLKPKIIETAQVAINNPQDKEAQKKLGTLISEAKSAIKDISQPYEMVSALNNKLHQDLDNLLKTIDEGGPDMQFKGVQYAKEIAADIKKQIEEAEAYANSLSDPKRKKEILDAVERLKQLSPQLLEAIKQVLANPQDKEARKRLEQLVGQVKEASSHLAQVVQPTADELKMEKTKRDLAYTKFTTPQPVPQPVQPPTKLKVEGPVNKAVFVAAEEVASAMEAKVRDGTPLGQLVSYSDDIAQAMAELSSYAAKGDVKGMIMAARKIADCIKQVQANAKKISDNCIDPRLKSAVQNYSDCGGNFSTQLKILCAVKSGSDDGPAAEEQLVTCARGLSSAVINIVKSAESAILKSKK